MDFFPTAQIELESTGCIEMDLVVEVDILEPEYEGGHLRLPAGYNLSIIGVDRVRWEHPDGDYTSIETPQGCIAEEWLLGLAQKHCYDTVVQLWEEVSPCLP